MLEGHFSHEGATVCNEQEKLTRLLDFLLKLATSRVPVTRELREYSKVLWLGNIPKTEGCYSRAWGDDSSKESDIWLEVRRVKEPDPPMPTEGDERIPTLDPSKLLPPSYSQKLPRKKAQKQKRRSAKAELVREKQYLTDYLKVQQFAGLDGEDSWEAKQQEYLERKATNELYSYLFKIYQQQRRLGEEYELVLAVGLLSWQSPEGQRIYHHLIVADALLDFNKKIPQFTVRANPVAQTLRLELHMLDVGRVLPEDEDKAKKTLEKLHGDPWDPEVEEVLKSLVHSIDAHGRYDATRVPRVDMPISTPIVEYAPALILRARSTTGLTNTLTSIKKSIQEGTPLPSGFANLAELPLSSSPKGGSSEPWEPQPSVWDGEPLFPKPYNEEQRRIVDRLQKSNGVLVQGPPGTGKSHTIANLICHLLATGNRLLVTSKTPRALEVLEELLPSEIRPLCVNVLGSGLMEQKGLETSVRKILEAKDTWDEGEAESVLKKLEQETKGLKEKQAEITRRLRAIRESETHRHTVGNGVYQGTASRIVQLVKRDKPQFDWFEDSIPWDQPCPVTKEYLFDLLYLLREFTAEKRQELTYRFPEQWLSPENFKKLVEEEQAEAEKERKFSREGNTHAEGFLEKCSEQSVRALEQALSEFLVEWDKLSVHPRPWIRQTIEDVVLNSDARWRELLKLTREALDLADEVGEQVHGLPLEVPSALQGNELEKHTNTVRSHLELGGALSWRPWRIRPKEVKQAFRFLKKVRLNGVTCDKPEQIHRLSDYVRVRSAVERACQHWSIYQRQDRRSLSLPSQIQELKDLSEQLSKAFQIEIPLNLCRLALKDCNDLPEPAWNDLSQVERLRNACLAVLARQAKRRITEKITAHEIPLSRDIAMGNMHRTGYGLREAMERRDVRAYATAVAAIEQLLKAKTLFFQIQESLEKLRQHLPKLTASLNETYQDPQWEERLRNLEKAWSWAQAKSWVKDYINKDDSARLAKNLEDIEKDLRNRLNQIVANRAWAKCFQRLTSEYIGHMEAWRKNMERVGAGKGKYASRFKKFAQEHLEKCRAVIPAWVMPLHRVWDTVAPAPNMFDVIIVDEASQCGFEALPLFYLGKKIVIVGDDKQISPEVVGVPWEPVLAAIDQLLYDFQYKTSFHVQTSLFDHGRLRFLEGSV